MVSFSSKIGLKWVKLHILSEFCLISNGYGNILSTTCVQVFCLSYDINRSDHKIDIFSCVNV